MTTKTKIVLAISLTCFALSTTGILWGLFLPVGAITFGVFLTFNLLGKQTAMFDEEQALRHALAQGNAPAAKAPQRAPIAQIARPVPTR